PHLRLIASYHPETRNVLSMTTTPQSNDASTFSLLQTLIESMRDDHKALREEIRREKELAEERRDIVLDQFLKLMPAIAGKYLKPDAARDVAGFPAAQVA